MIAALFGAAALAWIVEWTIGAAILLAALTIAVARGVRDFTRGVRRGYADPPTVGGYQSSARTITELEPPPPKPAPGGKRP